MSASQSSLDTSRYGYDFVVATTQASINATMKLFLYEQQQNAPLVTMVYTGDKYTSQPIAYDRLLELSHGSDPFSVPDGADPGKDKDLQNLTAAGFVYGFRLQVGLPPVSDPALTPDVVKLGSSASDVTFWLLSAELDIVGFDPGYGWTPVRTWSNISQQPDSPWTAICTADLRMEEVPSASFGSLPGPVQQQIKNLGGTAFSVQQLLIDLSSATLLGVPDVDNGKMGPLHWMLQTYFLDVYMTQLRALAGGDLILGCSITQQAPSAATMTLTDLNIEVSPFAGPGGSPVHDPTTTQESLATLNYLCASDNHPLPAPEPFTWNWIEENEKDTYDGVVAINRASFVDQIKQQMLPSVRANCYQPYVRVSLEWTDKADITMSVTPGGEPQINQAAITTGTPGRDLQVLKFTYHGHDYDQGNPSWYGTASLDTYYDATVFFSGSTITVEQNQKFNMVVTRTGATTSGTPVNIKRVDTCTIEVDDYGQLIAVMATPVPAKNDASQDATSWWGDMVGGSNSLYASTAAVVTGTAGTMLNTLPFTVFQYFVFPGGQTFCYNSVAFAAIGDLVSYIIYADPDSVPPDMSLLPGQVQGNDRLNDGQWLANDGYLVSDDGRYAAYLQDDGNFVLVHADNGAPNLGQPYWSVFANATDKIVGKYGGGPCFATMQSDGNFVLYNGRSPVSPGSPYWAISRTALPELGTFAAIMQNDANFVVYKRDPKSSKLGGVLFATNTDYISRQ